MLIWTPSMRLSSSETIRHCGAGPLSLRGEEIDP